MNMTKNALFLKYRRALGAPPTDPLLSGGWGPPLASGRWGLRLQTPPDEFLATRLVVSSKSSKDHKGKVRFG